MRVTQHSGKTAKNGSAYTTAHNDRNFDHENDDHIASDKQHLNQYWNRYNRGWYNGTEKDGKYTFEQAEKKFYEKHFAKMAEESLEKYSKNRHPERALTPDKMRKSRRYCPEEVVLQIGDYDEHVDLALFQKCAMEYLHELAQWNADHGNHMKLLDAAFHADEAVPHLQIRRVWTYIDENGIERIGQERALKEAGIELPYPDKPEDKHNNRKIVFDRMMRNKFIEICERNGINVDKAPQQNVRHNQTKDEFLFAKFSRIKRELPELEERYDSLIEDLETLRSEKRELAESMEQMRDRKPVEFKKIDGRDDIVAVSNTDASALRLMQQNYDRMLNEIIRLQEQAEKEKKRYMTVKKDYRTLSRFIENNPDVKQRFESFEKRAKRREKDKSSEIKS